MVIVTRHSVGLISTVIRAARTDVASDKHVKFTPVARRYWCWIFTGSQVFCLGRHKPMLGAPCLHHTQDRNAEKVYFWHSNPPPQKKREEEEKVALPRI